jgi:tetratricopeptide (TPR) repeat protein
MSPPKGDALPLGYSPTNYKQKPSKYSKFHHIFQCYNTDMANTGKELLIVGQTLREQGKTFEALDMINQSLDAFAKEQNDADFAHALIDRAICWQHLWQFSDYLGFAVLYRKDAEAVLELVKSKNIDREEAGAYFINAKAAVIFGDYKKAVELFEIAISKMSPDRSAQKGDWQTNLGKAIYFSGDKDKGLKEALSGIEQIEKYSSEADEYTSKVWLSGGYMRLAEMLASDSPSESKKYLDQAQKIVADPKFSIRQKQIQAFIKTGKTGL